MGAETRPESVVTTSRAADQPTSWHHPRISRCFLIVLLALLVSVTFGSSASASGKPLTRAQYAATLHRWVDPLGQALNDTYYRFTSDGASAVWATKRTAAAKAETRSAIHALTTITPPTKVQQQHARVIAALQRLDHDLQVPLSRAHSRTAVLNWWLQTYGSLREITQLSRLHESLANSGYWAS